MTGPVLTGGRARLAVPPIGWPLMPVPDADGALAWPDFAASVRQMIEVILRTAPGEQLMRPAFGAGLEALVNKPNTLTTRAEAQDSILAALRTYEPRVIVDRLDVDPGQDPREVIVTLACRLSLTGDVLQIQAAVPVGSA